MLCLHEAVTYNQAGVQDAVMVFKSPHKFISTLFVAEQDFEN
jgi:hypothetical protein